MLERDYVTWAYRILLGRDPESESAASTQFHSRQELLDYFLKSTEFKAQGTVEFDLLSSDPVIVMLDRFGVRGRMFVNPADAIGKGILSGAYEPEEVAFFRANVRPGATVLDVGANVGLFSMIASHLTGPSGMVYSFEALPENVDMIRLSVAENRGMQNVIVKHAIVADRPRNDLEIAFQPLAEQNIGSGYAHLGGSYLVPAGQPLPPHMSRMPIRALPLDDMVPASETVDFIKIDIDGAEVLAMTGATRILGRDKPLVMTEVHPSQLRAVSSATWADYASLMRSFGYEARSFQNGQIAGPAEIFDDNRVYNIAFCQEHHIESDAARARV